MSEDRFGKYTIQKRIAFGGMAEISLARLEGQDGFRKTCVLKRILPQYGADDDFVRMFIDEAVLAARLNHPNVVQTYDFGDVEGTYFIAMEYVDGPDLRRLILDATKSGRSLSVAEACALVEEVCRGLSYVHNLRDERGEPLAIVHRDVSPHNVMVARAGQAKIMDFGIAKAALRASQTRTGTVKGKLAYMAPEQASAGTIDKRTDQFAVGLVLWECLTGARYFEGASEPELFGKVLSGHVRDVRELRADVPEELACIVSRMLQTEPSERYRDLADAEQELSAFRFGLGPEGAVRLQNVVTELVRPKQGATDRVSEEPREISGSQASQGAARPEVPPGTRVLSDASSAPSAPSGWSSNGSGVEAETLTRSALETRIVDTQSAESDLASSPSIQVSANDSVPKKRKLSTVFGASMAGVVALVAALGIAMPQNDETPPESSVVEPSAVGEPQPVEPTHSLGLLSAPPGAAIVIDGLDTGLRTPTELPNLVHGAVLKIELQKAGFETWHDEVVVSRDGLRVEAKLQSRAIEPEPPKEPTESSLRLNSIPPGASIALNGERTGERTPATFSGLEFGSVAKVEFRRRGYKTLSFDVPINEDEVSLERELVLVPSTPAKPPIVHKPRGTGRLSLRARGPWVEVFIGNKSLGPTPLENQVVPAGKVTLRLKNKAAGVDRTVSYEVPRGQLIRRSVDTNK